MAQTLEERQKARIAKQIRNRIVGAQWYWRGVEFCNFGWCGIDGALAFTCFTAKYNALKVTIDTENEYNIPNQVRMFVGENAMEDAVNWTAERLLETYKTISCRTAPFKKGHLDYIKAIKGL